MIIPWKMLGATNIAASVVALSAWYHPVPKLVWNASASVPIGLYRIEPADALVITELVLVKPPNPIGAFLAEGGFLPAGMPMLKRIAALSGQRICRIESVVTVDDVPFGEALERDHLGRALPVWQGCVTLEPSQAFLLNFDSPASLDGRYFGPILTSAIIGRATAVWIPGEDD